MGLECRGSAELEETATTLLERTHKVSYVHWVPGQRLHKNLGQMYLWALKSLLGKEGSAIAHCGGKTLEAKKKKMEPQIEKLQEVFNTEIEDLKNKGTDEKYSRGVNSRLH